MSLEQQYYDMLTRNDHPVFRKLFDDVTTFNGGTPFNSILNLLVAKQMVQLRIAQDEVTNNSYPDTVTVLGIDRWEETLFGFTKTSVLFPQRVTELLQRFNENIGMAVVDVITLAQSIIGQTPIIIRNLFTDGWVLDTPSSVLDLTTILSGTDQLIDGQVYLVIFNNPVDSNLLAILDKELTIIEKAGSRHTLLAPPKFWVLDSSALGLDTILG